MARFLILLVPCLLVGLGAARAADADPTSDFVQVKDGHFVLHGQPFFVRGTNYFGSWRDIRPLLQKNGSELDNTWSIYRDATKDELDRDFAQLHAQLNANVIRIGTPALSDFQNLVQYNHFDPWYEQDGSISPVYLKSLRMIVDSAYAHGIRVELCLLWHLGRETMEQPAAFAPGGAMDKLYAQQVKSIVTAFRDHPGVMSYSIGNEVLVKWEVNGLQRSAYEPRVGGFILRRLREVQALAPHQLTHMDETSLYKIATWHTPSAAFSEIPDNDGSNGGRPFCLAEKVDYEAIHFYPVTVSTQDLGNFQPLLDEEKKDLAMLLHSAAAVHKPLVIGETGIRIKPENMPESSYGPFRDAFYRQLVNQGRQEGLQGVLAWEALPKMILRPGKYEVKLSTLNPYSHVEVDSTADDGTRHRALLADPHFCIFTWGATGDEPQPTAAARALAAWP